MGKRILDGFSKEMVVWLGLTGRVREQAQRCRGKKQSGKEYMRTSIEPNPQA